MTSCPLTRFRRIRIAARFLAPGTGRGRGLASLGLRALRLRTAAGRRRALSRRRRVGRGRVGCRCRWRRHRRATGPSAPAAAAPAAAARAARPAIERDPRRRFLGKADAADALDGGHLTTGQRHDPGRGAHGRAGRIGLVLAAAGLAARAGAALLLALPLLVCLRLRDREDDELRVGRDLRVDAARVAILLPGLQIADDQLAVDTLRRRRIREPDAVARQRRALDRLPRVVDVIGQRPLAGLPPDVDRENRKDRDERRPAQERPALQPLAHHHTSRITKTCKSAGRRALASVASAFRRKQPTRGPRLLCRLTRRLHRAVFAARPDIGDSFVGLELLSGRL